MPALPIGFDVIIEQERRRQIDADIGLRVTSSQKAALERWAREHDTSISTVVRGLIKAAFGD